MEYKELSEPIDALALLKMLKNRLRIFHGEEDEMLRDILDASVEVVTQFTGVTNLENATYRNLILTRAMYVFNDQAEFFFENYRTEINDLALMDGGEQVAEQKTANA